MFRELLAAEFAPYSNLSDMQLHLLEHHYHLLGRWNEKINLTRIRSLVDSVRLHYCESLFLARSLPLGSWRIVDVGSGAGFPGIPVAILRMDCTIDLVESHQRKAVFLRESTHGLSNVRVVDQRAESLKNHYDWMVARAVRASEIIRLTLAPKIALLVGRGEAAKLDSIFSTNTPWGHHRALVHLQSSAVPPK